MNRAENWVISSLEVLHDVQIGLFAGVTVLAMDRLTKNYIDLKRLIIVLIGFLIILIILRFVIKSFNYQMDS